MTPVTDADRQAALLILKLPGHPNMAQAQAVPLHARMIEIVAAVVRNRSSHLTRKAVRRIRLDSQGQEAGWCTQLVAGPADDKDLNLFPKDPNAAC